MYWRDYFELEDDCDLRAVKRAYATKLKTVRPESDPDGFITLKSAYDAALEYFARQEEGAPKYELYQNTLNANGEFRDFGEEGATQTEDPHTSVFYQRLCDYYWNPATRFDYNAWRSLVADVSFEEDDRFDEALLAFVYQHYHFRNEVWAWIVDRLALHDDPVYPNPQLIYFPAGFKYKVLIHESIETRERFFKVRHSLFYWLLESPLAGGVPESELSSELMWSLSFEALDGDFLILAMRYAIEKGDDALKTQLLGYHTAIDHSDKLKLVALQQGRRGFDAIWSGDYGQATDAFEVAKGALEMNEIKLGWLWCKMEQKRRLARLKLRLFNMFIIDEHPLTIGYTYSRYSRSKLQRRGVHTVLGFDLLWSLMWQVLKLLIVLVLLVTVCGGVIYLLAGGLNAVTDAIYSVIGKSPFLVLMFSLVIILTYAYTVMKPRGAK